MTRKWSDHCLVLVSPHLQSGKTISVLLCLIQFCWRKWCYSNTYKMQNLDWLGAYLIKLCRLYWLLLSFRVTDPHPPFIFTCLQSSKLRPVRSTRENRKVGLAKASLRCNSVLLRSVKSVMDFCFLFLIPFLPLETGSDSIVLPSKH